MPGKNTPQGDAARLRQQAEKKFAEKANLSQPADKPLSPEESQAALHELQVHQIELEMQNEELRRAQKELEASRQRYADLYDTTPVGYCTIDEQGIILESNHIAASLFGTSKNELVKYPLSRFICKEDQDAYYLYHKKLFSGGGNQDFDLRMLKNGGTMFWVHLTTAGVLDADGTFVSRVALNDISSFKRDQEHLASEIERREALFEQTPVGIVIIDTETTRILEFNRTAHEQLGYSREEFSKLSIHDVEVLETAWETRAVIASVLQNGRLDFETRQRTRQGEIRDVFVSAHAINVSGRIIYQAIWQDITERKKSAEEILRLNRLYTVTSQINQAVVRSATQQSFFESVCRILTEPGGFKLAWIGQADQKTGQVLPVSAAGSAKKYLDDILIYTDACPEARGPTGTCIREVKTVIQNDFVNDADTSVWHERAAPYKFRASAAFPIVNDGHIWGALTVYTATLEYFGSSEKSLLEEITVNIGFAIANFKREELRQEAESDLRESEARLTAAQAVANIGSWETDLASLRVIWSDETYRIFEVDKEGFNSTHSGFLAFVHPEDRVELGVALRAAHDTPSSNRFQHRIVTPSGVVKNVEERWSLVHDNLGHPVRAVGTCQDITDRKKVKDALAREETHYRSLVNGIPGIVYSFSLKRGGLYYSPQVMTILGYSPEQLIAQPKLWNNSIHVDDVPLVQQAIREAESGKSFVVEYRIRDAFGNWHWFIDRSFGYADVNGDMLLEGLVLDITEGKLAEEKLYSSHQLLEKIISSLPVRVFWKDKNLVYLGCNTSFARDAGFTDPSDIIGKDDFQMAWGEQAEQYRAADRQVIESGDAKLLVEEPQKNANGDTLVVLTSKIPLRNSTGEVTGILGTYIDITERKQSQEKIKASLAEKEVILKEIHHRVKNNMQVISSLLQLQASKIKDPAYIQMFKDSQERIRSMALVYERLNQSEDMARIELRTYVSDLVAGLVHSYSVGPMTPLTVIDVADIRVSLDLAIPCGLIINEIISNSLKYAFKGGRQGTISVSIKPCEGNLEMLLADDGVGLPEGVTFENARSLGMSLIKTLVVHQLDGKLELKRENGTGYAITLPYRPQEHKP